MRRTTIFITPDLWQGLLLLKSKKRHRVTLSALIREAVAKYLKDQGVLKEEEKIERALKTRGALSRSFENQVKEAQKIFEKWNLESV